MNCQKNKLLKHVEVKAIDAFHANKEEVFPMEVAQKIALGNSPIKVLREYRKISQIDLAKKTEISRQYLCQIENKTRLGNVKILKKIASILNVDMDLLVE